MCCGDANQGQLGLDLEALRNFDRVTQPTELEIFRNKNVQMVACGKYHSLFLIDGQVWACGANKEGQIGNGSTQTQYKPIPVKSLSSIFMVSAWG